MIKIKIYIVLFLFKLLSAEEININIIVENCKACHNLNSDTMDKIPSLSNLENEEFISLMRNYKSSKDNNVMTRISRVLTNQDISKIANIIYEKK